MTKQQQHFYSHLTSLEPIIIELSSVEMSESERAELITIITSNLHYTIIDVVLSELTTDDKKTFLQHMKQLDHEKTWIFLNQKTKNIEEKIKKAAEDLKNEVIHDIHELKTMNKSK